MSLPPRLQDEALSAPSPRRRAAAGLVCALLAAASWIGLHAQPVRSEVAGLGTLVVEWPSRRASTETGARVLETPVLPGSVAHVFALAAAADAGLVSSSTTHLCRRVVTADGRRFVCTHPDLKRPLTAAEVLAYACTDFFVDLAAHLPRASLNDVRRRVGLPAIGDGVPWASAVLGFAGPASSPRQLMTAVARVAGVGPDAALVLKAPSRALVRAGLRGVPDFGAAAALAGRGRPALMKSAVSPLPGGRALALVMAFAPAEAPTRAVLVAAPSGAGFDAAVVAADLLAPPGTRATVAEPPTSAASTPSTPTVPAAAATLPAGAAGSAAPPATGASGAPVTAPAAPATDDALRAASGTQVVRVGVALPDGKVRIDTLPLEEYVSRVISGEGQPRAGAAAHEALAVVIRTFALANRHRHRAEGYDLCDSTHCQVMRPALKVAREAALATAGRVLLDKGQPAFVYYSANCGGIPALASEVWPGAVDYQPGEAHDDACENEPSWTSELTAAQVERALRAAGLTGKALRNLTVAERTTSNRAGRLRAEGFEPSTVSAYEFRMAVGRTVSWQQVKSTSFELTRTASGYRFHGMGYGHGVGLCVVGAGRRAARGESATQILRAYFGDLAESTVSATTVALGRPASLPQIGAPAPPQIGASPAPQLGTTPAPVIGAPAAAAMPAIAQDVRVILPPDVERERSYVTDVTRRARADVAMRAGAPEPATLSITVHPSVAAFGHATGQPWWVAASTVGMDIDLLPLDELRRRGTLETTLRHAVAHVVLDPLLRTRPAWVREGASLYFSSPPLPPSPPGAKVSCPSDAELLRPVSGGAEREAFSRADRCFRRQLAQGRAWRDVR